MKKIKLLTTLSLTLLLFAGCSDDDSADKSSDIPSVPEVSFDDGSLEDHSDMTNTLVTKDNLTELYSAFQTGFGRSAGSTRNTRNTRESGEDSDSTDGLVSGYKKYNEYYEYPASEEWEKGTFMAVASDFSNDGKLYIGGAIAGAYYDRLEGEAWVGTESMKGEIRFAGSFKGSIIYDVNSSYIYHLTGDAGTDSENVTGSIILRSGETSIDLLNESTDNWIDIVY